MQPSATLYLEGLSSGDMTVDLAWTAPRNDGGMPITDYEFMVINPDGAASAYESTGSTSTTHRVRGLARGLRYGFQVRARNKAGVGPGSNVIYVTPLDVSITGPSNPRRIEVLDFDRQSFHLLLEGKDCKITVAWNVTDSSWHMSMDVVAVPVVRNRRMVNETELLPTNHPALKGNIKLIAKPYFKNVDPKRDCWISGSHDLFWIAAAA